ncbi:putative outer membrane starch-binding protein [Pontibacter ummariensis]|uniref:Starch-binding associating with outer membrane n=1 Tax=Pontibacter ummariensis TaxID=1610492 RepID=A0A239H1Y2_9BACT|nr:RagB/SusD family nutrient uptake outer membrane protein [Pontibacter ummariensis]PRY10920.1 putative outer membrane starch-binding protein [Pontibacter ummariensis]SNS75397.1 Starch-binding associating with outer membrane [Pontibacter ummariensis]
MNKKYIKSLFLPLALSGVVALSSCESYLDVENPSTISQEAVFTSVGYANSAVTGIYNSLMGDNGYGSRISTLYPNGSDDIRIGGTYNPLDRRGISGFGVSPDNTELNRPFLQLYQGIERANIAIKYIPVSNLYNNGTPAEQAAMRKLHGEALTLRALFYHELIRNWGDVPAPFEPSADQADLYLAKTNQDDIYDRLLDDLALASELVPWKSESGDPSTRITKSAVKGLRARLALARGGYALRRDSRKMERRADYKDYYAIARQETLDLIQSGRHSLHPSYEQVFKDLHTGASGGATNEMIFEIGAFGGNSKTDSKLGYSNGLRIDKSSKYGQANGQLEVIPTYFYEFGLGDVRRDVTIAFFQIDKDDNKELTRLTLMRDGKFRKYWTSIDGTAQNMGINWPVLRYADVLLMFAEAENELNGPTPQAIEAYEQVRKRAFAGNEESMGTTPTDKEGFFNAVVQERFLEFGGEGIRKYDLIRWNRLSSTIAETKTKLTALMNGEGRYANVPEYVYYNPTPVVNTTVPAEVASFDFFGGAINKAMYSPAPVTTPSGYTRVNWRAAVNEEYIATFAIAFEENKSELFPIYSGVLNQNYNLTQDYGY